MKKKWIRDAVLSGIQTKTWKIMRLNAIFLFLCLSQAWAISGYSQATKLTLKMSDSKIIEVLDAIEEQSEFYFLFNQKLVDVERKVDIDVQEKSIDFILQNLFAGTNVNHMVLDRQIVLTTFNKELLPQQQRTVSGTVTDESGQPLPGVTVVVKGTTQGTVTNADGKYSLSNIPEDATLVFSFVGMQTQEVAIEGRTALTVVMEEETIGLEEVVAVGYGTRAKGQLTGSVSNLDGENLTSLRTTDLTKSLQGAMPGLIINDLGGEPGRESTNILIRGTHTLGNNTPLFVIDGVPRSGFGQLSSYDIEEITVLKDASAAIYGARAANGVIIVTTKRGKTEDVTFQVNSNFGVNALTRMPNLMDSWQYAIYQNEAQQRTGSQPVFTEDEIEKYRSGSDPLTHPNTDWYRATFRDYANETHHNISASGGTEKIKFFVSGDFLNKESLYSSEDGHYNQYQLRSNTDAQVHKYLNVGVDLGLRLQEDKQPPAGIGNIIHRVWFFYPTEVDRYPNGLPGAVHEHGNTTVINSFETGFDENIKRIIQTKLSFNLNMNWITEGLEMVGYSSFDYDLQNRTIHMKPHMTYRYNPGTEEYEEILGVYPGNGRVSLDKRSSVYYSNLYHIRLAYDKSFEDHNISAFVAYEQNEAESSNMRAYRRDLFSTEKLELFAGGEDGRIVGGSSSVSGRVNYFGNVAYDYKRKYLVEFTLRRDGSFNFPRDKRFGTFPGITAGWNISKEPFMAKISQIADNIKLRISYGEMGNDAVAAYQYLTKYVLSGHAIFGTDAIYNAAMTIQNVPNPNITWETSKMQNYGLDATFFNGKLDMTFDYFYEKRRGILIKRNLSVPLYTALTLPDENLGKVDNWGYEIAFNHRNMLGRFDYNVGGNFTFTRNKIIFMDESPNIPEYQKRTGFPVNSILSYSSAGIFSSWGELDEYPHLNNAMPGDLIYLDLNDDQIISNADMKRYYSSPTPEMQFALNGGLQYKGLDLFAMFQGQTKATTVLMYNDPGGKPVEIFENRWTEDNPNSKHPRAFVGYSTYQRQSNYHHQDASYIRLKNLEVGYNVSSVKWIYNNMFKKCRVYLRGRNLWTLDYVKIFDPEVPYQVDYGRGSRAKYYPQTISYSIGVNITF